MKRLTLRSFSVLLVATLAARAATSAAARAAPTPVTRVYTVVVSQANDHAFRQGVKDWNHCLQTHGAHHAIQAYDAETGNLGRYLFVVTYPDWAAMDQHGAAGKDCQGTFEKSVSAYVSRVTSHLDVSAPKMSYYPGGDVVKAPMLWVTHFRVKPGHWRQFKGGIEKFAAAAAKTHWQGHFLGLMALGTGRNGYNFIVVWPNQNWADVGTQPKPSQEAMMNGVYGKAVARMLDHAVGHSIADMWSDIWKYDAALTYTPGK